MTLKSSFAPIINERAKILILGSLPGDLSIAKQEYYAHPQNRFWKLIFQLHQQTWSNQYATKVQVLKDHHLALWDICATASRLGSMDNAIHTVIVNPINELLISYPNIQKIVFNGKKAQQLHDQQVKRSPSITYITLPSSSPANALWNFEKLIQIWGEALKP